MYLETWMMVVLAFAFGGCAWFSTTSGFIAGRKQVLTSLYQDKIISLNRGKIVPYNGDRN